ncbi:type IX secretion system membrane protein PorP/SprF [Echinicola sp. CAU 1574]|uniref:Type IX secretion system membrane protein PorP/SprF n=1 Tax=Echinicola arenosa TaxID=2774144 RepID=A0ABR9AMF3_9BACT|nr:type IX secretion system membrane protein PorP/SprF [Echinicola arenosa]MBD8489033.1 type IX secretion system membrane protein PorP/SprF [Echinicola arenosa]
MKRTLKIFIIGFLIGSFGIGKISAQQLPQFSQYMFNGLHINPGYAGYKGEPYIQSTYRSQWVNFPGAPKTFTLTADLSANEGKMGFGISFLSDKLGPANTNGALLTYAYRIQTGVNSFLGLGISGGVSEYAIDGSMLDPNDYPDAELPQGRINLFTPNMNGGIFFHTTRFYAGLSAYNMVGKKSLEREDVALAYHDFHYYLTAGLMIPFSENVQLKPSFLIKEVKGSPTNFDLNAMFLFYERIWLGGSYRANSKLWNDNLEDNLNNRNALALILEIFATNNFRIGYAYDHSLNVLNNYRNNSHEVSIGYYISPKNVRIRNQRWF